MSLAERIESRVKKDVLVVGGAGYVGSVLVPKLLDQGHKVRVFDLYTYSDTEKLGADVFGEYVEHERLEQVKGDVRDGVAIEEAVSGMDNVIHLACLSNDPTVDLDPELSKQINYLAFFNNFLRSVKKHKTDRLVYASTASVYGVKTEPEVTEGLPLEPLTAYAWLKVFCEKAIQDHIPLDQTTWVILRPSTVYGYGPRQRLDLSVNILTSHALNKGLITVFGGQQQRPNIHIQDVTDLYVAMLYYPKEKIAGKIFNAGRENLKMIEIAEIVQEVVGEMTGKEVRMEVTPSSDLRSYRVSSEKIRKELGWEARREIREGIRQLIQAFQEGKIPDPLTNTRYSNIQRLKEIGFK